MFHDVGAMKWPKGSLSGAWSPENFEILHSRRRILSHPGPILNEYFNIISPFLSDSYVQKRTENSLDVL